MKQFFTSTTARYLVVLFIIEALLFITNFTPGTYLIGWDNIMPEFNLGLNLNRSFLSLWQEYRGLGTTDGLAHAANLMHTVYIWLLSRVLPQEMLRYTYIFLTHAVGVIAFFFLARYLLKKKSSIGQGNEARIDIRSRRTSPLNETGIVTDQHYTIPAFLGALFYGFNLGVIQMYFAPLEVFATHFAALPIMTVAILNSLKSGSKSSYLLIIVLSILFSPQGFVPTLFAIYFLFILALLGFSLLHTRRFTRALTILALVLAGNAFWIAPYLYSAAVTPSVISEARINQYGSEEIFYRNKARGDLVSVLTMQGFMIDTIEFDHTVKHDVFLMEAWRNHLSLPVSILSLLLSCIAIAGGIIAIIKRQKAYYPFVAIALFCFVFLANNTLLLEQFNAFVRNALPLLGEAYRFPFTKLVIMLAFCLAVLFSLSAAYILKTWKRLGVGIVILVLASIGFVALPVLRGQFISPLLRVPLPQAYLQLFSYFDNVGPENRIATLPLHSFWNWQYRSWGHRGSGFLWYGIRQPILERAFDPWSLYNEQYYNELSYALSLQDKTLFRSVLEKYDISYLVLDQSIQNTLSTQPINYDSLKRFLDRSEFLTKEQTFDFLTIYHYKDLPWVTTLSDPTTINSQAPFFTREDSLYQNYGNYLITNEASLAPLFPSLATTKLQSNLAFDAKQTETSILLTPKNQNLGGKTIVIPSVFAHESLIPFSIVVANNQLILTPIPPTLIVNGQKQETDAIPISLPLPIQNPESITHTETNQQVTLNHQSIIYLLNNTNNTLRLQNATQEGLTSVIVSRDNGQPTTITLPKEATVAIEIPKATGALGSDNLVTEIDYEVKKDPVYAQPFAERSLSRATTVNNGVLLESRATSTHIAYFHSELPHQADYILLVNNEHKAGLPLNMYVDNPQEKRAEIDVRLATESTSNVIILPKSQDAFEGYGFHFIARSVGTERAESLLQSVSIYPIPLATLEQIVVTGEKAGMTQKATVKTNVDSQRNSIISYTTAYPQDSNALVLSQAYDPGWKAYAIERKEQSAKSKAQDVILSEAKTLLPFLFGKEIKDNVVVNSWANGWILERSTLSDSRSAITIVFLPQYFGFIGLLITGGSLLILLSATIQKREK